jgi:hypothetical protein
MKQLRIATDECPVAPAPRVTVHTRVLHRACQILGGAEALSKHLGVPVTTLHRWLEGDEAPPASMFLKAVDLILPTWGPEDDALARAIAATKPKKN